MFINRAKDVTEAYLNGLRLIEEHGVEMTTRNGPALVCPAPVVTVTERPDYRVLIERRRDANPFFHLFEAMWMLAGRDDVAWISRFNRRMATYSDDGERFHGAYGHRWRGHFRVDQLKFVADRLLRNPTDRRVVIQMWDPAADLGTATLDVPCNTTIYPRVVDYKLDLTICCRSNDAIWGCHGSNAVHFSILQEYLAARIGVRVGTMYQVSNNYHAYVDVLSRVTSGEAKAIRTVAPPIRLVDSPATFDTDLRHWMDHGDEPEFYSNAFFQVVLTPMLMAWTCWEERNLGEATAWGNRIGCEHWRAAVLFWLALRAERATKKAIESLEGGK